MITYKKSGRGKNQTISLRSTAKNAYELLDDVAKAIIEEPKRYNQGDWGTTDRERIRGFLVEESKLRNPEPPQCGTMACRAGWIVVLTGRRVDHPASVEQDAVAILGGGIAWNEYQRDIDNLFSGGAVSGRIGTRAYAREGVRGIRKFQKKWKERLLATPIAEEQEKEA